MSNCYCNGKEKITIGSVYSSTLQVLHTILYYTILNDRQFSHGVCKISNFLRKTKIFRTFTVHKYACHMIYYNKIIEIIRMLYVHIHMYSMSGRQIKDVRYIPASLMARHWNKHRIHYSITARKLLIAKLMQFAISAVDKLIGRPQIKGNNRAENL